MEEITFSKGSASQDGSTLPFGAYLRSLRERARMKRTTFFTLVRDQCMTHQVLTITEDIYRRIESGRRAPCFEELFPLLAALVEYTHLTREEIHTCLTLARVKIESLRRKRPPDRLDEDWQSLERHIVEMLR